MKKKGFKTMAVSAVAGCLILSLSATAFAYTGSGYTDYKEAIKATMATKNATVSAQYEVKDQGVIILSGNSTQKLDNKDSSSKSSITVDGTTKAFETSKNDGNLITKADGQYFSATKGDKQPAGDQKENLSASGNTVKLAEMLTDTLVGDVKNQFVENGQTISVQLEGAQIPELARLALSAAAERSNLMMENKGSAKQGDAGMKPIMDKMPKLSNVEIKSIAMTATVDGTTLKDNEFNVAITGTDANGVAHELTLKLTAKITDVGNTKVEAIDTAGQEVTPMNQAKQFHNR